MMSKLLHRAVELRVARSAEIVERAQTDRGDEPDRLERRRHEEDVLEDVGEECQLHRGRGRLGQAPRRGQRDEAEPEEPAKQSSGPLSANHAHRMQKRVRARVGREGEGVYRALP